jgi:hypothetical protein
MDKILRAARQGEIFIYAQKPADSSMLPTLIIELGLGFGFPSYLLDYIKQLGFKFSGKNAFTRADPFNYDRETGVIAMVSASVWFGIPCTLPLIEGEKGDEFRETFLKADAEREEQIEETIERGKEEMYLQKASPEEQRLYHLAVAIVDGTADPDETEGMALRDAVDVKQWVAEMQKRAEEKAARRQARDQQEAERAAAAAARRQAREQQEAERAAAATALQRRKQLEEIARRLLDAIDNGAVVDDAQAESQFAASEVHQAVLNLQMARIKADSNARKCVQLADTALIRPFNQMLKAITNGFKTLENEMKNKLGKLWPGSIEGAHKLKLANTVSVNIYKKWAFGYFRLLVSKTPCTKKLTFAVYFSGNTFKSRTDYERPLHKYISQYLQTNHEYKTAIVRDSGTLFIAFNAMWEAAGKDTVPDLPGHDALRAMLPTAVIEDELPPRDA